MPAGSVIKVNVVYDEPFWRADGLSGQAAGDRAPIKFTFDNSPPSGTPGRDRLLPRGRARAPVRRASTPTRVGARCWRRSSATSASARPKPIDFVEQDWSAEEWTRGCYGAHLAPGVWTQFGPALREPIGRIHWAGHRDRRRVERLHGRRALERRTRRRRGVWPRAETQYGRGMPILDATPRLRPPGRRRHRLVGELLLQRVLPGRRRGAVHADRRASQRGHDGRRAVGVAPGQRARARGRGARAEARWSTPASTSAAFATSGSSRSRPGA